MNVRTLLTGTAANVLGTIIAILGTLLMARLMPADAFGEFRVGVAVSTVLVPVLMMGSERYCSRAVQTGNLDHILFIFKCVIASLCIGAFVMIFFSDLLIDKFLNGTLSRSTFIVAVLTIIPFGLYNLTNTLWRHSGGNTQAQVSQFFVQRTVKSIVGVISVAIYPLTLTAMLATFLCQIVLFCLSLRHLKAWLAELPRRLAPSSKASEILNSLLVIGLPLIMLALIERIDIFLVNKFFGKVEAGSFDLALTIAFVAFYPMMSLSKSTEPFLFECQSSSVSLLKLKSLVRRSVFLSAFALLALYIIGPSIDLVLKRDDLSVSVLSIYIAGGLVVSGAFGPVVEYLQITGRQNVILGTVLVACLPIFFGKYFIASEYSLDVVAFGTGAGLLSFKLVLAVYIRLKDKLFLGDEFGVFSSALVFTFIWLSM